MGGETVCKGGLMNRGCMLDGAVVQYGLTCCPDACKIRGLGTFDADVTDDAVNNIWTTERAIEYRDTEQCKDDCEGIFTGVAVPETISSACSKLPKDGS